MTQLSLHFNIYLSIFPELDPRLSGLVWTAMLASLALVITIATPSSIITLIASIILRMIFSVGVEPTLWLLGVLNVSHAYLIGVIESMDRDV